MIDMKLNRVFLKKQFVQVHASEMHDLFEHTCNSLFFWWLLFYQSVCEADLYIGSTVTVFARQLQIVGSAQHTLCPVKYILLHARSVLALHWKAITRAALNVMAQFDFGSSHIYPFSQIRKYGDWEGNGIQKTTRLLPHPTFRHLPDWLYNLRGGKKWIYHQPGRVLHEEGGWGGGIMHFASWFYLANNRDEKAS